MFSDYYCRKFLTHTTFEAQNSVRKFLKIGYTFSGITYAGYCPLTVILDHCKAY